ncbi:MAG: hypothetical protein ABI307_00465 [Mycobacterium sp.]
MLILAPLLRPGYLLLRDAVSTPRSYLSDVALGLGEAAPRAVPQDFAVALGSHLVDGGIVVKALLAAGLWLAGWGAARLVTAVLPESGMSGQLVAITVVVWNPYVAERLLQGHWSLLIGYGCLPWVAAAALRWAQSGDRRALCALMFWMAAAGLTPTGLLLAVLVALAGVAVPGPARPGWLRAAVVAVVAAVATLPWSVALLLGPSSAPGEVSGVAAFAARAEPGLGTLGSLVGLGGIWNSGAVPDTRTTLFALPATLLLAGVLLVGLPVAARRAAGVPLLALAVAAVLAVAALATGPGQAVLRTAIEAVPSLGVLRDGQKWVALTVPGYALAAAASVVLLKRHLQHRWAPAAAATVCCVALIATLPDLAWGAGGRVAPVHYPPAWPAVAAMVNADPRPVAVLPAGTMRRFAWAGPAPVLDPLPRWVRADVLATGDLTVSGKTVPGEGSHGRAVQELLLAGADPAALVRAGVGWVVVESGTEGETGASATTLARLQVAYRDADLTLYRVGGDMAGASAGRRRLAVLAHLAWLALLVAGAAGAVVPRPARTPG